jgi:pyrophosphatase PpaX
MIRCVLFDLDGTLADTELVLFQTMIAMMDQYRPNDSISFSEILEISGPPLSQTLRQYFPEYDTAKLSQEFSTRARSFYPRFAKPFPHALETIQALIAQGMLVGIVTSKLRRNAVLTLEVCGLPTELYMITLDEVIHPKPDPEGIQKALQHFHVTPEETLFVGDTVYDYHAGKNAGVHTALVSWSLKSFDASIQPTLWLQSLSDLMRVVNHGV